MIRNAVPGLKSGSLEVPMSACADRRCGLVVGPVSAQVDDRFAKDPDFNPGTNAVCNVGARFIAPSFHPAPSSRSTDNDRLPAAGGPPR